MTDIQSLSVQMHTVKQKYNVSYLRQWSELAVLCVLKRKISLAEYYQFGLWRPELRMVQKAHFTGARRNRRLTEKLNNGSGRNYQPLFDDKLIFDTLTAAHGLTPPPLQAYFANTGVAKAPVLRTARDIENFLTSRASFPLFCKPRFGSLGQGALPIDDINPENRTIQSGGNKSESVGAFAARVVENSGDGYLFQTAIQQHSTLVPVFGKTPVVFRIVTVNPGKGNASVAYVAVRASDPEGMGVLEETRGLYSAEIDASTGRLSSDFWKHDEFFSDGLHRHTAMLVDRQKVTIPDVDEMCRMAQQIHDLFPTVRILGFDFILSEDGPVILEGNFCPYTQTVQRLRDKGINDFDDRQSEPFNLSVQ